MYFVLLVALSSSLLLEHVCLCSNYYVGAGIADVTGPAAELNMMGYANPGQTTHGIHMRQFARAFVFANTPGGARVVFVNLECAWAGGAVKRQVVTELQKRYGPTMYTEKNICISGTHTHSGTGGYSQYLLFDITALGFNTQAFNALVDGIVVSIVKATESIQEADVFINRGELMDSNINRSPTAYLNNPEAERAKYKYNVDKDMVVLKMVSSSGVNIGMISWFAVHCTSMNNTNQMISSDNKGYAAQMMEMMFNPGMAPGKGPFVAAFAQSNEGDVSPNTRGPHCMDTGKPCDVPTSTCNGKNEMCVASGPGPDMFASTEIIGGNQFKMAVSLFNNASEKLSGPVDFRHTFADMTNQTVKVGNTSVKTCKPSMGYSFAAGTTDGPGAFNFTQGSTTSNPFWNFVRNLIHKPSQELVDCQKPKPILLPTGEISYPYLWQPEIVPTQLLRIGQLVVIPVPGEFTTMSGRRMRNAVKAVLVANGMASNMTAVIAGLSNEYADYITTFEEYQIQRYEGGSTIYGPRTLDAYIQLYESLATAMTKGTASPAGPSPPNLISQQLDFLPGVIFDSTPSGKHFGDVLVDAPTTAPVWSRVSVRFQTANPRNNLRTNDTFSTVEYKDDKTGKWSVEFTDCHWETRFHWIRTESLFGYSEAVIEWDIPHRVMEGTYRIRHFGSSKSITGSLTEFVGSTREFNVVYT